jgi:hypothetical protein
VLASSAGTRVRTSQLSPDQRFRVKLIDAVGLDRRPPERALGLCADEQSQIQALDRRPPGLDRHLIVDPYPTPKPAPVRAWLARPPRFPVPFIPTSGSGLNWVERGFRAITTQRIRRGT